MECTTCTRSRKCLFFLTALTFSDVGVLITNVQFIVDITSMVREYLVVEVAKYFFYFCDILQNILLSEILNFLENVS